jgi:hypothetical protein
MERSKNQNPAPFKPERVGHPAELRALQAVPQARIIEIR